MRSIAVLFLYFIIQTQASLLVVVPIMPKIAYDVQMRPRYVEIVESETGIPLLEYAVPHGCSTADANIYQKGRNLVFEVPCRIVFANDPYSIVV